MVVCADGSVGLLLTLRAYPRYSSITFGSDGPVKRLRKFHRATGREIIDAGLVGVGVGCNQMNEVMYAMTQAERREF